MKKRLLNYIHVIKNHLEGSPEVSKAINLIQQKIDEIIEPEKESEGLALPTDFDGDFALFF